jgi:hypothetical protein
VLPAGLAEQFLAAAGDAGAGVHYEPHVGARVRAHFVDARAGMDAWEHWYYLAPIGPQGPDWESAEVCSADAIELQAEPAGGASFGPVPAGVVSGKAAIQLVKALADHVYRSATVTVFRCPELKLAAAPGGTESEFRARVGQALREKRDAAVDALRRKYATRLKTLQDRQRRAEQRLEREKSQASSETMSSALSVGGSLLGALFGGGRRSSTVSSAARAARSVGRIGKERGDVANAEAELESVSEQYAALEAELQEQADALEGQFDPATVPVETVGVRPRKTDIAVSDVALVWRPA